MAAMEPPPGRRSFGRVAFEALREIAAVIVAILLALAINEWWEDHERNVRKAELTEKLYLELAENLGRLRTSHQHHTEQLDLIRARAFGQGELTREDFEEIYLALYRKGILKPALLTHTNWEIAKLTDLISYMEMEQLRTFTRLFALHEVHDRQLRQNADTQALSNAENDPEQLVELSFQMLNEIWWAEKTLIEALEAALAGHDLAAAPGLTPARPAPKPASSAGEEN